MRYIIILLPYSRENNMKTLALPGKLICPRLFRIPENLTGSYYLEHAINFTRDYIATHRKIEVAKI